MPNMDGLALAEALGRMTRPPPVVFVSGFGTPFELAGPYLSKPFLPDALLEAVTMLLDGKQ